MTVKLTREGLIRNEWSVYDGPVRVAIVAEVNGAATLVKGECDIAEVDEAIKRERQARASLRGGI